MCAGKRFVRTTFEQKDRKKYDAGLMVKSRNEPCQLVQVRACRTSSVGHSL